MKLDRLLQVAYEMTFRKEPTITKDEAEDRQGNPTTMYTLDGTLVLYACKSPEGAEGFALDVIVPGRDEFEGADYTEIGWYPNLALVVTTAVGKYAEILAENAVDGEMMAEAYQEGGDDLVPLDDYLRQLDHERSGS